jgi:cell division protein FtsB
VTRREVLRLVAAAGEARTRRRQLVAVGAAVLLATMPAALSHQYAKTYALARERTRLEQYRRDLIADNARLRDEIERLQTDDRYLEEIARRQLGLVRPGEIELLVVPYDGTAAAPARGPRGAPPVRTGDATLRVWVGPEAARGSADASAAAQAPPRPGVREWAAAVRDALRRLLLRFSRPR